MRAGRTHGAAATAGERTARASADLSRSRSSRSIARVVGKKRPPDPAGRTRPVPPVRPRSGPGLRERLRSFRRGRWFRAAAVVVAMSAVGGGLGVAAKSGWNWITHSPRLAIREIVVRSGQRVSEGEVRRLANLAVGDNIIAFRLRPTVEAIELHPWVKRAAVTRELPDRVVIEVVEREPAALVNLGALYYVDDEGEIFKKVLPGETVDYPVFTGITLREAVEDKEGVTLRLLLGLSILAVAEDSMILPAADVSEIKLDRTAGATVVRASDGLRLVLGQGDVAERWQRAERALVKLGDEAAKVAELDLNYESRVTVRLKDGYPAAAVPEEPAKIMTNN